MDTSRPYILVNIAATVDGKIDTVARRGAQISSPQDWERVDRLRASCDAIMVGGKTLHDEDPRLLVKSSALRAERVNLGQPENPIKVAIASQAGLRENSRFLNEGNAEVIIFAPQGMRSSQLSELESAGAEVVVLGETRVDIPAAIGILYGRGIRRLMVEGGGTLISELFKLGYIDELYVYIAPLIFGGSNAPTMADGTGIEGAPAIKLRLESVTAQRDGGVIIHYFINNDGKGA